MAWPYEVCVSILKLWLQVIYICILRTAYPLYIVTMGGMTQSVQLLAISVLCMPEVLMLGVCIGALLTSVWPPSPRESFKYIYKIHIWSLVPIYVTLMTLLPITVVYKNTMDGNWDTLCYVSAAAIKINVYVVVRFFAIIVVDPEIIENVSEQLARQFEQEQQQQQQQLQQQNMLNMLGGFQHREGLV